MPAREEMQQPVFAATDVLEYPELHDESIPFIAFMTSLARLFRASGIKDFTMQVSYCRSMQPLLLWLLFFGQARQQLQSNKETEEVLAQDVCKPEAPRLRKQLSAIVNFARHREHKVAFWVDAAEQTAQAQEEAAELHEAKDKAVCPP